MGEIKQDRAALIRCMQGHDHSLNSGKNCLDGWVHFNDPIVSSLCSSWKSAKSTYQQALESGVRKSEIATGMEQGLREMPMVLGAVEGGKRAQVLGILHNSLVMTFPEFFKHDVQLLAAIVERSKIRNAREYYLVRHRIDELEGETSALDECGLLYKLVDEFES